MDYLCKKAINTGLNYIISLFQTISSEERPHTIERELAQPRKIGHSSCIVQKVKRRVGRLWYEAFDWARDLKRRH